MDSSREVKIIVMSDTHGHETDIKVPQGDWLIHCGDYSGVANDFDLWLSTLSHQVKIVVPGNHDSKRDLRHATYVLTENIITLPFGQEKARIFGCSYIPHFIGRWWSENENFEWPSLDFDFLLTHGPAYGILDGENKFGCKNLRNKLDLGPRPLFHLFGHIHEDGGKHLNKYKDMSSFNVSLCDENNNLVRSPIVLNF